MNPFQTVSYAPIDAFRDLANLEHAGPGVCNGILLLWQTFLAVCAAWKQAHERQAEKLDDVGTNVPPRCRPTVLPASIILCNSIVLFAAGYTSVDMAADVPVAAHRAA